MIRRYTPIKKSVGTTWPIDMKLRILHRDAQRVGGCVGFALFPTECAGALEVDHVRASHGMGMKSVSCDCNGVSLCGACHLYKTLNGRLARMVLLKYLERFGYSEHADGHLDDDCGHVDPVFQCDQCQRRAVRA